MRNVIVNKILLATILFAGAVGSAQAGQLTVGAQFQGWNSNYLTPLNGYEVWTPLSFNFKLDNQLGVYGQTEYGWANYTGSGQSYSLNNFSDSVVGMDLRFTSFSLPSMLNIGVNLPTGDTTWEGKQQTG